MKAILISVMSLALTACAANSSSQSATHTNLNDKPVMTQVQEGDAGFVFYRDANDANVSVNVYINGEYLSSIQPGHFAQIETCSAPQRIGAFVVGTDKAYESKRTAGAMFTPQANTVSYFRVTVKQDGHVSMTVVDPQQAQQEVSNVRQSDMLSRVDKKNTCPVDMSLSKPAQ